MGRSRYLAIQVTDQTVAWACAVILVISFSSTEDVFYFGSAYSLTVVPRTGRLKEALN